MKTAHFRLPSESQKRACLSSLIFSQLSRRAAFVYFAKERYSQSSDLQMLQRKGYVKEVTKKNI